MKDVRADVPEGSRAGAGGRDVTWARAARARGWGAGGGGGGLRRARKKKRKKDTGAEDCGQGTRVAGKAVKRPAFAGYCSTPRLPTRLRRVGGCDTVMGRGGRAVVSLQ